MAVAVVAGLVAGLAIAGWLGPNSRQMSHLVRGGLAGVGIALAWVGFAATRVADLQLRERITRAQWVGLAFVCVLAAFNYFQFDRKVLFGINDYTDTAYYYTNSKYLGELGYDGLYAGALVCDVERGAPRTKHIEQIRDLRDDELRTKAEELEHGAQVKANFTPERWSAFCHDITFFLDRLSRESLETNFFVDHGYNPPPTWTVVGGALCELVSVEQLKWICSVDTALVIAMFGVVFWAFGFEPTAFALLFYLVTFSGRWPILGMAILRFDWVVGLTVGVALLKRGWYGSAGVALAYAALNRVFPALFFWGWLVEALIDTVRERRLLPKHVRLAAAAAVTTVVLSGTALVEYGPTTVVDSVYSLRLHNESFSSHRVGLGTVLVWQGETTKEEIRAHGGMRAKELKVQATKWWLRGFGVAACVAIGAIAWLLDRLGRPASAWEMVAWVTWPLFCATTPQVNYYNFRTVSHLWHSAFPAAAVHTVLLSLLLATEAAAQVAQWSDWERHAVNAVSSCGMLAYFLVMVGSLVARVSAAARERSAGG